MKDQIKETLETVLEEIDLMIIEDAKPFDSQKLDSLTRTFQTLFYANKEKTDE